MQWEKVGGERGEMERKGSGGDGGCLTGLARDPRSNQDRRSGGFPRCLGGLGVLFVCKCRRDGVRRDGREGGGGLVATTGEVVVEVRGVDDEAEAGFVNRKCRQLMYTHLPQIDLLYTAARHHEMKLGKPVGPKRNRAGPHGVLKTLVPSPIAMSTSHLGGATPCPMIGGDASSSGDRNAGWPLNFQRRARDWPPLRPIVGKPGRARQGTDAGWGGHAKKWRWAGPAAPI
jgi:hypothetical protein